MQGRLFYCGHYTGGKRLHRPPALTPSLIYFICDERIGSKIITMSETNEICWDWTAKGADQPAWQKWGILQIFVSCEKKKYFYIFINEGWIQCRSCCGVFKPHALFYQNIQIHYWLQFNAKIPPHTHKRKLDHYQWLFWIPPYNYLKLTANTENIIEKLNNDCTFLSSQKIPDQATTFSLCPS